MTALRSVFAFLGLAAAGAGSGAGQTKMDVELAARRHGADRVAAVLLLREQPQREIMEKTEAAARLHLELAEGKWREASQWAVAPPAEVEKARALLDETIVKTRRSAFSEIRARIRASQESVRARLETLGATEIREYTFLNLFTAHIPGSSLEGVAAHPDVAWISALPDVQATLDVSVPGLGVAAFWNRGGTGGGETAAVVDSGIRSIHPAFSGVKITQKVFSEAYRRSACFDDVADTAEDRNGHGTHVAGIVASGGTPEFSNLEGVAKGLGNLVVLKALFQAKLIPGQCGGSAEGNGADILAAIDWAVANTPARIFNFSFGAPTSTDDSVIAQLFDQVVETYRLVLSVSAGNEGPRAGSVGAPGNAHNVISVANYDDRNTIDRSDDVVAEGSSRGPTLGGRAKPDLAAPGTRIRSTAHNSSGFVELSGTSMAAPHVTGAAALLFQAGLTQPLAVKALLINSAEGAGWRADWGWGALQLARAQQGVANVRTGRIAAGTAKFYRGRISSDFKATLVWNRHIEVTQQALTSTLNNLDLELFDRTSGSSLSRSDSTVNNVEQVRTALRVEGLVKVVGKGAQLRGGVTEEPYALAISEGFTEVNGPVLSAACSAPASVNPGGTFAITCQVRNSGGLDAMASSAVLALPAAFRTVAPVNIGTIGVGGSAPVLFTLTAPAGAGVYEVTVNVTSNTFGETFRTSSRVNVPVAVTSLPAVTLTPASLEFRYRSGGALPAAQTVEMRTNGIGISYTAEASSSGNWLSVSPTVGALPGTLRAAVNPQSLSPGTHSGTITVRAQGAANTPLTIPVTMQVETPSEARLAEHMTTKSVPEGCATPISASTILPTDARVFVWFRMVGAARGDRANVEWVAPDGVVQQTGAWQPLESAGNYCFYGSLSISGSSAATKTGTWRVVVTWNGGRLFTLEFVVGTPVTVRKSVLAKEVNVEEVCAEPAGQERFFTTDKQIYLWFILDRTKGGEVVRYEFESPGATVALSGQWSPLSSAGSWCFRTNPLRVADTAVARQPGTWKAKVFLDGDLVLSFPFELVKGFTLESVTTAKSVSESGCTEPDPHGGFYRGDARAYVWFQVSNPAEGDEPMTEWITPAGETYTRIGWDPVPSSGGSRCYWAWIDIAESTPATMLGEWKVIVKWNGEELTSLTFHILSVEIMNRMTTAKIPEGTGCPVPTPTSQFAAADESVTLWFLIRQASAGDAPRVEWFGPNGQVAFRSSWTPLPRDGNFCFTSTLRIAGNTLANQPGEWVARVFWNDAFLFNQRFTIVTQRGGSGGGTVTTKEEAATGAEVGVEDAGVIEGGVAAAPPRGNGRGTAEWKGVQHGRE